MIGEQKTVLLCGADIDGLEKTKNTLEKAGFNVIPVLAYPYGSDKVQYDALQEPKWVQHTFSSPEELRDIIVALDLPIDCIVSDSLLGEDAPITASYVLRPAKQVLDVPIVILTECPDAWIRNATCQEAIDALGSKCAVIHKTETGAVIEGIKRQLGMEETPPLP